MYSVIHSFGLMGISCFKVEVEADITNGMPSFEIVGLPDAAVKESRDRVRSAIKNCGFTFPLGRITVNLAPADTKKIGPVYDLPMMLAILSASGQIEGDFSNTAFVGELSLNGEIRSINGVLSMAINAEKSGLENIVVPFDNRFEAGVIDNINILAAQSFSSVIAHFCGGAKITPYKSDISLEEDSVFAEDFFDVKGQGLAKRAIEIAAAGGHNILMIGPPGSGKSMLAKRIPSILPEMTFEESVQTTEVHSVAGELKSGVALIKKRPFRAPHHTVSPNGLVGGGAYPRPGEVSLAHNGVLFLDELPEFDRNSLDILRQPIEDGEITVSRVAGTVTFPCSFMLVGAMNPCKCGYRGHPTRQCTCPSGSVKRYINRISGPLLDRFDIHIEVAPVKFDDISKKRNAERSEDIRKRVNTARAFFKERMKALDAEVLRRNASVSCNAEMTPEIMELTCVLTSRMKNDLKIFFEQLGLSARAYDKILRVARTIADLEQSVCIQEDHLLEAIQYRSLDRKYWDK